MGKSTGEAGFFQGIRRRFAGRHSRRDAAPDALTAVGLLEQIHDGRPSDYCLMVHGSPPGAARGGQVNIEQMLIDAFAPLPCVRSQVGDAGAIPSDPLAKEAFATLAAHARVLLVVLGADEASLARLRWLKESGHLRRGIFLMPDEGTLPPADWPREWSAARTAAAAIGLEISGYTPGGWLFRIDNQGRACTFRPILNPNPEKIAKALEAICAEMA